MDGKGRIGGGEVIIVVEKIGEIERRVISGVGCLVRRRKIGEKEEGRSK